MRARALDTTPVVRAARSFLIVLAVTIPVFVVAKWAGLDGRPWTVVLTAAVATAALVATWRLVVIAKAASE